MHVVAILYVSTETSIVLVCGCVEPVHARKYKALGTKQITTKLYTWVVLFLKVRRWFA